MEKPLPSLKYHLRKFNPFLRLHCILNSLRYWRLISLRRVSAETSLLQMAAIKSARFPARLPIYRLDSSSLIAVTWAFCFSIPLSFPPCHALCNLSFPFSYLPEQHYWIEWNLWISMLQIFLFLSSLVTFGNWVFFYSYAIFVDWQSWKHGFAWATGGQELRMAAVNIPCSSTATLAESTESILYPHIWTNVKLTATPRLPSRVIVTLVQKMRHDMAMSEWMVLSSHTMAVCW